VEASLVLVEAIQEYRRAIKIDPNLAQAHSNLGLALSDKGQLDEAVKECRTAIDIDSSLAQAQYNLGGTLLQVGRLAEARDATRRCLELLSIDDPLDDRLRPKAAQLWEQCEQLLALDPKLPTFVDGKHKPADDAERLALARLCRYKKRYVASSHFFADAFAHDARLADDMQTGDRYNAACVAALASCRQGADAEQLEETERMRLRKQAAHWLRADLAFWTKLLQSDKPDVHEALHKTLKHWQEDPDLSGLRDAAELAKLPADEREACRKLWADVQALLDKAEPKK
jgi:tetratricopeptide (TPR) repeat protein